MKAAIRPLLATALFVLHATGCQVEQPPGRIVGLLESDRVEISAEVAERITARPVSEGEAVEAGQLLMSQDLARISASLAEAEAVRDGAQAHLDELVSGPRQEQITAARARLQGARQAVEFRTRDFNRIQEIEAQKLAAPETLDRATAALDAARAELDSSSAHLDELLNGTRPEAVRQAEQAVLRAEAALTSITVERDRHQVSAPVDGIVDTLLLEVGERPVIGQVLVILLSGAQPHARVYVPEADRVRVQPGTSAKVFVDGLALPFDGRVRWVASESTFTPYFALTDRDRGYLTYVAKIDILNADSRLPDGIPVQVELDIDRRDE